MSKWEFKDPRHRKILNLMGFSDDKIDEIIKDFFITDQHHFVNFVTPKSQIEIIFPKREFKQAREYKPDKWNPYPAIQPPNKEVKYLVSYKNGVMDVNWWCPDILAWQDLNGQVVAFRALPPPYKPEPPKGEKE